MAAEPIAAFVLASMWAIAGAASAARPNLQLGKGFMWTCWALAAIAAGGAVAAVALDVVWPATWLVGCVSAVIVASRLSAAREAATTASAEGLAALIVIGMGVVGAAAITGAAWALRAAFDWPQRLGMVILVTLAGVAGVTFTAHIGTARRRRVAIWLVGGLGGTTAISGLMVAFVHLLVGEVDTNELPASEATFAAAASALVSLALVPPLLLWIERRINADRPDAQELLTRVDDVAQRRLPLDETLLQTCELLRRGLKLERVEAWTAGADELTLRATDPHGQPRRVPLGENARRIAGGVAEAATGNWVETWLPGVLDNAVGEAATSAVSFGGDFQGLILAHAPAIDETTIMLLDEVAHRLGPVMHSASLDASLTQSIEALRAREQALRASRERLVAAADNERARIERDLHDGAQQHLVALSVNLQLARSLVRSDPDRAEELLGQLTAEARLAVEDLRSLSHGIFPKTLEDEGIGPALDEAASHPGDVDLRVSSSGIDRYSREIESAVYFTCNEAITNAVKHANASTIRVNLAAADHQLVFEVIDDGRGFDVVSTAAKNGLTNMADRLGAVDGTVSITSDASGTRVLGTVPLS